MANQEVGVAYVALMPSMDEFNKRVRQAIKDNMNGFSQAVNNAGGSATEGLEKAAKKLADTGGKQGKEAGASMGASFTNALETALNKATHIGVQAGSTIANSLKSAYSQVGRLVSSMASSQIESAASSLGLKIGNGITGGLSTAKLAIGNMLGGLLSSAASMVTSSVSSAIGRVDTMKNFPKIMANMGISAEDSEKAIQQLSDAIDGLPTSLDAAALGTERLVAKNGDLDKSTKYFTALNNAIIAGGASAELQSSAVEQLTQSYSKGQMDMMEWRSLQMAMPAQLNQVAEAMGLTTEQLGAGLRKAEKSAEYLRDVSMDEFMDTLVKLNEEGGAGLASFAEQAKTSSKTISTALTNVQNRINKAMATLIDWVGQETIFDTIESVSTKFGPFANDVVSFLDKIEAKRYIGEMVQTIADGVGQIIQKAAPLKTALEPLIDNALPTALTTIQATLETITANAEPLFAKASEFIERLPEIASNLQPIIDAFINMKFTTWEAAIDMWESIIDALTRANDEGESNLTRIIDATSTVNKTVGEIVGKLADPVITTFADVFERVSQSIEKVSPALENIVKPLADTVSIMADQILDVVDMFTRVDEEGNSHLSHLAENIKNIFAHIGNMDDENSPFARIVNAIEPHIDKIGDAIEKIVTSGIDGIANVIERVSPYIPQILDLLTGVGSFVGEHLEGILMLVGAVKGISTVMSAGSGLSTAIEHIGTLKDLIGGEGGLLSLITGTGGAGEAISGAVAAVGGIGPALGIVGAIAAVAGSLIYCWNTSEEFQAGITGTLESIQAAFGRLWDKVGPILQKIWDFLGTYILPILKVIAEVVGGLFLYAFELAGEIIVGVLDTISGLLDVITGALDWMYKNLLQPIIGAFKDLFDWINKIEPPEWWGDFSNQFTNNTSVPSTRPFANGGIAYKPTNALIAEAGTPEAVVPLSAQGIQRFTSGLNVNYTGGGSPTINVEIGNFINNDTTRDVRSLSEEIGRDTLRQLKQQGVYA